MLNESRISALVSRWVESQSSPNPLSPQDICKDEPEYLIAVQEEITKLLKEEDVISTCAPLVQAEGDTRSEPAELASSNAQDFILNQLRNLANSDNPAGLNSATIVSLPPGFRYERELGRGGMGAVYLAHQAGLNRAVAVKVMLAGANPKGVIRFLAEAESVASVRHVNVVEVYQFGEHSGQPFLVLEYCSGGDLTSKTKGDITPREAAELMMNIAEGVNAAHLQGIVHRDLKPQNILLSGDGTPKVSDFGLAKRGLGTDLTASEAVMGTPAYMSPEQAGGGTKFVGPESDVWTLGVMLYELLSGAKPFVGPSNMEYITQILGRQFAPLRTRCKELPRDLELIVSKCLRQQPRERYANAGELAADLRHWLEGKPISARPMGSIEAAWKWSRRNPAVAVSMLIAGLALISGTLISAWQAVRATEEAQHASQEAARADTEAAEARRQTAIANDAAMRAKNQEMRAEEEASRATSVNEFLVALLASSDALGLSGSGLVPPGEGHGNLTLSKLIERGSQQIQNWKAQDKSRSVQLTRAALLDALGDTTRLLGQYQQARPLLREAVDIRRELLPETHPDRMASELHLANWYAENADFNEAEEIYSGLLEIHRKRGSLQTLDAAEIQLRFAFMLLALRDERGVDVARQGLKTREQLLNKDHRDIAVANLLVAANLFAQGDIPDGARSAISGINILNAGAKLDPNKDPILMAVVRYQTGYVMKRAGFESQALENFRESAAITRKFLGSNHVYLAAVLGELGFNELNAGEKPAAYKTWQEAIRILRSTVGIEHPAAILIIQSYAELLIEDGKSEEAWKLVEETLRASEKRYGRKAKWRLNLVCTSAGLAVKSQKIARAKELASEAITLFRNPDISAKRQNLIIFADMAKSLGRLQDLTLCREAYASLHTDPRFQTDEEMRWFTLANQGNVLAESKHYREAAPLLKQAINTVKTPAVQAFTQPFNRSDVYYYWGKTCWADGRVDEATTAFATALKEEQSRGTKSEEGWVLSRQIALAATQQQFEELSQFANRYEQLKTQSLTDRTWCLAIQAVSKRNDSMRVLERLEALSGNSSVVDVSMYRAWTVLIAGGNVEREAARLAKISHRGSKYLALELSRIAVALQLKEHDKALSIVERIKDHDQQDQSVTRLAAILKAETQYRNNKSTENLANLRKEIIAASDHINAIKKSNNPDISGYSIATDLFLKWRLGQLQIEGIPAKN